MLDNTYTMTIDSASVTLTRVSEQNYSSLYTGESADGSKKYALSFKHTLPKTRDAGGEKHLMRLDEEEFDTDGVYVRTSSIWVVLGTFDNPQVTARQVALESGFYSVYNASLAAQLMARES